MCTEYVFQILRRLNIYYTNIAISQVEVDYSPSAIAAKKYRSRDQYRDEDSDNGGGVVRGKKLSHSSNRHSDDENDYHDNRTNRKGFLIVYLPVCISVFKSYEFIYCTYIIHYM